MKDCAYVLTKDCGFVIFPEREKFDPNAELGEVNWSAEVFKLFHHRNISINTS